MFIYEVDFKITKESAKSSITIHKQVIVVADSVEQALAKFTKTYPKIRATTYTVESIYKYSEHDVIT